MRNDPPRPRAKYRAPRRAVEGPPDSAAIGELRERYDTKQLSSLVAGGA
jgi:hypothetical protein